VDNDAPARQKYSASSIVDRRQQGDEPGRVLEWLAPLGALLIDGLSD